MPKPNVKSVVFFVLLALALFTGAGCVDAKYKSNSGGSTGTVIDFAAPMLLAVAVDPTGAAPHVLEGAHYLYSLWRQTKKDGSLSRYFVTDQAPGANFHLAVEVSVGAANAFGIRGARGNDESLGLFDSGVAGGPQAFTAPLFTTSGLALNLLFTPVAAVAAVAAPGAAPSNACFAGTTNAFINGAANNLVQVFSPSYQTESPFEALVSEMNGLRIYNFHNLTLENSVTGSVEFSLSAFTCAVRLNVGEGDTVVIGRSVTPDLGVGGLAGARSSGARE